MNEFTAIMKKISVSGTKSADLGICIAKKTRDPPIDCPKSECPPHMHSLKTGDPPPPYILPPPSPLKFMNSPWCTVESVS